MLPNCLVTPHRHRHRLLRLLGCWYPSQSLSLLAEADLPMCGILMNRPSGAPMLRSGDALALSVLGTGP